jgi:hypothetical protein
MNTSQQTTGAPGAPGAQHPTNESADDRATLELRRWLEAIERAQAPVWPRTAPPPDEAV